MLSWDRRLVDWVAEHRVGPLDPLAQGLTYAGVSAAIWLLLAAALTIVRREPTAVISTLAAAAVAMLATDVLKELVDRERPDVDRLVALPVSNAFPSGHASTSFACATVLGALEPRLRVPLYVLAALIALSRTYVGVHYPLDLVAGAALGLAVGFAVLRALRRLEAARRR